MNEGSVKYQSLLQKQNYACNSSYSIEPGGQVGVLLASFSLLLPDPSPFSLPKTSHFEYHISGQPPNKIIHCSSSLKSFTDPGVYLLNSVKSLVLAHSHSLPCYSNLILGDSQSTQMVLLSSLSYSPLPPSSNDLVLQLALATQCHAHFLDFIITHTSSSL